MEGETSPTRAVFAGGCTMAYLVLLVGELRPVSVLLLLEDQRDSIRLNDELRRGSIDIFVQLRNREPLFDKNVLNHKSVSIIL